MKRFLLWSFDRGSFQYDVMCGIILAFIFLPGASFKDRPDYMKVSSEPVRKTVDKNGNAIYTVKLETPFFFDGEVARQSATRSLERWLGTPVSVSRVQPIYHWTERLTAYAVWIER